MPEIGGDPYMLRLVADENLDANIVRGLRRRLETLDLVRVQDVGLSGVDDPEILEWAAREGRVLVTHDVATVTRFAYERVAQGLPMAGVIEIVSSASIGQAISELALAVECFDESELANLVLYIPL